MVWRKGIKITLLIVGVRLFGDARCSKDQLISSFGRGEGIAFVVLWALIFLRGWRKLGEYPFDLDPARGASIAR